MRNALKLGGILFIITAICVGLLGGVHEITTPIIKENSQKVEEKDMQELIKEAQNFKEISSIDDAIVKNLYQAFKEEVLIGYVAKLMPTGYGGTIELLLGIDLEYQIKGIKILNHQETPGFGANAMNESFLGQFTEKKVPLQLVKTEPDLQDIQAITGATITSSAIVESVNQAIEYIRSHQNEWGN